MGMVDLQEKYKSSYTANEQPEIVDIPEATYVSILGDGTSGSAVFYEKKKALLHFVDDPFYRFKDLYLIKEES